MAADGAEVAVPRTLDDKGKALVREAYDRLRAATPGFEQRRAQLQMIGASARALGTSGGLAVVEAGTGTGKSLSYLTAGIPTALEAGKKLVISTGTVALQEQLVSRDIPLYLESTGTKAKVALGKGRQRFLCVRNLADLRKPATQEAALFDDLDTGAAGWPFPPTAEHAARVESMADEFGSGKWDGDLDGIEELPAELKRLVTTTSGGCSGSKCPYSSRCPALLSRKELKHADVVVVNHALLLADLLIDDEDGQAGKIVAEPELNLFVFDEAHQLPGCAIDAASAVVAVDSMAVRLSKLHKLVVACARALRSAKTSTVDDVVTADLIVDVSAELERFKAQLAAEWTPDHSDREPLWRAPGGVLPQGWMFGANALGVQLGGLMRALARIRKDVRDAEIVDSAKERLLKEVGMAIEHLQGDEDLFDLWGQGSRPGAPVAKWVTLTPQGTLVLHAAPVAAGPILESAVWSKVESALLTSATMGSGDDFTAFADSIGLPEEAEIVKLDSPFDLERQAVLQVPWMSAPPTDHEGHCRAIADWLISELDWSKGTLVLFTSKRKLNDTLALLPDARKAQVLAQGSMSKQRILDQHGKAVANGRGSVIAGLASFGEGVDLKGDLATTVVITQLPFAVPTDPIGATLAEWYEQNGRNPFKEIAIPDAIRILTQYCGRLIRTASDTGRICILDRRLIEKSYGRNILAALPPFRREIGRPKR